MTELLTPRLRLRPWHADDRAPFAAINAEPAVQRYLSPSTPALSDALLDRIDQHFAGHGWGFWAVEDRATETLIGLCGLAHIPWEAFFTPAVESAGDCRRLGRDAGWPGKPPKPHWISRSARSDWIGSWPSRSPPTPHPGA